MSEYTMSTTLERPYDEAVTAVRAAVLPCNVAVRALDDATTVVEAFDPDAMTRLAGDALCDVAADARTRLDAALTSLKGVR